MTQSDPKRHHYVPEWHLRRFVANPQKPRLACYSKSRDTFFTASTKNLAAIGHYYTWRDSGLDDALVEKGFAMLDSRAAEVLPKLERGGRAKLSGTEPNVVATYVAMQQGRVPAARDVFQELIEHIGARGAEAALAAPFDDRRITQAIEAGFGSTREEVDELRRRALEAVRSGEIKITMDHIVTASVAAMAAERAVPILESMHWLVVYPQPDSEFVISDNPVTLFSDETPHGLPLSYLTLDIEVAIPLSSRAMLLMTHIPTVGGTAGAITDGVLGLNRRRWLTAREYVFGSSEAVLHRVCDGMPKQVRTRQLGGVRLVPIDEMRQRIEETS
jgi:Protein of unknown function (DUF4238)